MKLKIGISQLIAKILLTQWSLNQVRQWVTRHSNPTFFFFDQKTIEIFQWVSKSKFLNFMSKMSSSNGNETISDILSWDIKKY